MKTGLLLVGGLLLLLIGAVWTLQGLGLLGGSAMTGVTLWAIIGPVAVLAGVIMLGAAMRRRHD